jgi:recombination protein RecA
VALERLLVVRPGLEALSRVAIRLVESQAFAIVVVDLAAVPGAPLNVPLGSWPRIVRRLALALEGTEGIVLLVTDAGAERPLPLPVAQRIELARPAAGELALRVAKDRRGRISAPRTIAWARAGSAAGAGSPSVRRIAG